MNISFMFFLLDSLTEIQNKIIFEILELVVDEFS